MLSSLLLSSLLVAAAHSPEASYFARASFGWLGPTLRLGAQRPLQQRDLPALQAQDTARVSTDTFDEQWTALAAVGTDSPRLVARALWRAFGAEFAVAGGVKLASDLCQIGTPLLLKHIIGLLERGVGLRAGIGASGLLLIANALQAFCLRHYFALVFRTGLRMRASLTGAVYRKLLRLAPAAQLAASSGEVTNLVGADAQRVADLTPYLHALWFAPLQVTACLALLWREIGISSLPGLALIAAMLGANKRIAAKTFRCQQALLKTRDERVKLVRELIGGIRAIKLQAWEMGFEKRVHAVRAREVLGMRRLVWLRSLLGAVFASTPSLVAVAMLAMHTLRGRALRLQTALTVLTTVNLLRAPLVFLPLVLQSMQEADLSLQRMQRFLCADEHTPLSTGNLPSVGLEVVGADFTWRPPPPPPQAALPSALPPEPRQLAGVSPLGGAVGVVRAAGVEEGAGSGTVPGGNARGQRDEAAAPEGFRLRDLNLRARPGDLLALVGGVGSGKSSVISALLGDLALRHGTACLRGRVAYVAQTPFLASGSVRENILFGAAYEEVRYRQVTHACALDRDFAALPAADLTQIGAKGLGLSGGQRARVSLARAAYADAQIYLLDDPLAAVDGQVANWLMEKVIGPTGLLRDKVRVLATNSLDAARSASEVVVLRNGDTCEQGTFEDLAAREGELHRLLVGFGAARPETPTAVHVPAPLAAPPASPLPEGYTSAAAGITAADATPNVPPPAAAAAPETAPPSTQLSPPPIWTSQRPETAGGGLATGSAARMAPPSPMAWQRDAGEAQVGSYAGAEAVGVSAAEDALRMGGDKDIGAASGGQGLEHRQEGRVPLEVYKRLLRAVGGARAVLVGLTTLAVAELLAVSQSWWLTHWSKAGGARDGLHLGVYAALAVGAAVVVVVRSVTVLGLGLGAGIQMHDELMLAVVRAPCAFFDVTPLGRIINRLSKDLQTAEVALPSAVQTYGATLFAVLSSMAVVCTAAPAMLLALAPIVLVCLTVQRFYMSSSREIKRLEAIARAPLLSQLGEALDGLGTIRAYDAGRRFEAEYYTRVDDSLQATLVNCLTNCWLGLRLELMGACVAALFATLAFARNEVRFAAVLGAGPGGVGTSALGLTLALQVAQSLNWFVRQACDVEAHMVSVERLQEYDGVAPEPGYDVPPSPQPPAQPHPWSGAQPSAARGGLELKDVSMRYRDTLPLVLRGVSASIRPRDKVGVVGRTGSGKSSLLAALTRLVAPPQRTGAIELDGVEIATLNLLQHRAGVAVIPQEPVLFAGTIGSNLDPEGRYAPELLWAALQRVQLAHAVRSLDDSVAEGGLNLSAGQRQLLCIARALLAPRSLVILDEATSSVDAETDALIQRTLSREFHDATVIAIAHRLSSVLDADKILLIDEGRLVESGSPKELMSRTGGRFRALVQAQPE